MSDAVIANSFPDSEYARPAFTRLDPLSTPRVGACAPQVRWARLLFRRPWVVEAASDTRERRRWRVVGWRASRELLANVANASPHGHELPATNVVGGAAIAAP
jgi:hypothetical protein